MRQIDNMTPDELETLTLKGMLTSHKPTTMHPQDAITEINKILAKTASSNWTVQGRLDFMDTTDINALDSLIFKFDVDGGQFVSTE